MMNALKEAVCARVDELAGELVGLSHAIHGFAEPAFDEHLSAAAIVNLAMRHGMRVKRPVAGLRTAFVENISHLVPAIHPMMAIADGDTVPHTAWFAAAAISARADRAVLDGAKALAMTAIDVWRKS